MLIYLDQYSYQPKTMINGDFSHGFLPNKKIKIIKKQEREEERRRNVSKARNVSKQFQPFVII